MIDNRLLLALCAGALLIACGDDEPGTDTPIPTPDAGNIGGGDGGTDGGTTPEPDAGPGTDTETPPPPPPVEDCTTDNDEDGNGLAGCADPACESLPICRPSGCDTLNCPEGTECGEATGFTCLYPETTPETYEPSETWAYISTIRLGPAPPSRNNTITEAQVAAGETGVCCFDITGSGFVDNGLAAIGANLGSLVGDLDELLTDFVQDGTAILLAEYKNGFDGTNPSQLHFFIGDAEGGTWDDWSEGNGTFTVTGAAFGPRGSLIQFNRGTFNSTTGAFASPPEQFSIVLPLASLGVELAGLEEVRLDILDARLEAALDPSQPTDTVNPTINGVEVGGARLGGYITLDSLFSQINQVFAGCGCATGSMGESPSLIYGDNIPGPGGRPATRYSISCSSSTYNVDACEAGTVCTDASININLVCSAIGLAASLLTPDFDTDGNGVNDSVSVGLRLGMVKATIGENFLTAADEN
jgi:hypothetical protein